ncbi:GSCOCG00010270001-RA-CDS, partial [Cotesia congregata]
GEKIYSLAYADDVALLAKNEDEMKGLIRSLERYVERKKLEVNVEKTKAMIWLFDKLVWSVLCYGVEIWG